MLCFTVGFLNVLFVFRDVNELARSWGLILSFDFDYYLCTLRMCFCLTDDDVLLITDVDFICENYC